MRKPGNLARLPWPTSGVEITKFTEGNVTIRIRRVGLADDDMIENLDLEQLPAPYQVACDLDVPLAGRRVAGWMIVH